MTVEVIGVDDAEPWLAGASAAAQARAEHQPDEKHQHENDNQHCRKAEKPEQNSVVAGQIGEELHISIRFRCALNRPQPLTYPLIWDGVNVNNWLISAGAGRNGSFRLF